MNHAGGHTTIDWRVPEGRPDALHGDGATKAERLLANSTGILAAVALVIHPDSCHFSLNRVVV